MMYTGERANAKRCLMMELIQAIHTSAAPGGPESPIGCLGQGCMWWLWDCPPDEVKGNKNGPLGHCGLVGKP